MCDCIKFFLTWFVVTTLERISGLSGQAAAYRRVIDHLASRVQTTGTQTWIRALLVHTGSRWRTLGADETFRSAGRRGT